MFPVIPGTKKSDKQKKPKTRRKPQRTPKHLAGKVKFWQSNLRGSTRKRPKFTSNKPRITDHYTPRNPNMPQKELLSKKKGKMQGPGMKRLTGPNATPRSSERWQTFLNQKTPRKKASPGEEKIQQDIQIARKLDTAHQLKCANEPEYYLSGNSESINKIQNEIQRLNKLLEKNKKDKEGLIVEMKAMAKKNNELKVSEKDLMSELAKFESELKIILKQPKNAICKDKWPNLRKLHANTEGKYKKFVEASMLFLEEDETSESKGRGKTHKNGRRGKTRKKIRGKRKNKSRKK